MRAGLFAGAVELFGQRPIKNVVHEGGFSGAGNAGDNSHYAQGEGDVQILEIIFPRAEDADGVSVCRSPLGQHIDLHLSRDVGAGERVGRVHDFRGSSAGDQVPAVASGARTKVDYVVGAPNGVFVMFNHQHGVPEITKIFQGGKQTVVVAMMQADGRLVEYIENAAQARADLGG